MPGMRLPPKPDTSGPLRLTRTWIASTLKRRSIARVRCLGLDGTVLWFEQHPDGNSALLVGACFEVSPSVATKRMRHFASRRYSAGDDQVSTGK
jgi:hypothetical protein